MRYALHDLEDLFVFGERHWGFRASQYHLGIATKKYHKVALSAASSSDYRMQTLGMILAWGMMASRWMSTNGADAAAGRATMIQPFPNNYNNRHLQLDQLVVKGETNEEICESFRSSRFIQHGELSDERPTGERFRMACVCSENDDSLVHVACANHCEPCYFAGEVCTQLTIHAQLKVKASDDIEPVLLKTCHSYDPRKTPSGDTVCTHVAAQDTLRISVNDEFCTSAAIDHVRLSLIHI